MQNRGALWVFTILLALACLWQLSFSFFTGRFERKVEAEAKLSADSLITATGKTGLDFDSVKLQFTNKYLRDRAGEEVFLGYSYSDCKEKELNLGLDLKGGMAVTLEVSIPELIDNLSDKSQDPTFRAALKNAREAQRNDNRDFITIFSEEFRKLDPNAKMAAVFHSPDKATMFPREASNDEIIASLQMSRYCPPDEFLQKILICEEKFEAYYAEVRNILVYKKSIELLDLLIQMKVCQIRRIKELLGCYDMAV